MDLNSLDHIKYIENYAIPVVITDDEFNIVYANSAFSKFSKYSLKRIKKGNSLFKYLHIIEEDRELFLKQKEKRLVSIGQEINVGVKDSSILRVQVTIISTEDSKGNLGFIINFLDISVETRLHKHFRLKTKLEELDREKTAFFQNVSHELRTPLTLIMNPLEELYKKLSDNEYVDLALKNTKRLYRLVNQILDVQKVRGRRGELELAPVDLITVVKICTDFFVLACEKKKIKFKCKVKANKSIFIKAEIDFLEKIIFNLLSNALKFTPEKGDIKLEVLEKNNRVRVEVKDTGVGIEKNEQKKLFKVFSQISNDADKTYEGSGLGLALVKDLTESMGGEIGVESEKGKGSTFWVEFEQCDDEEVSQDSSTRTDGSRNIDSQKNLGLSVEGNSSSVNRIEEFEILSKEERKSGPLILVVDDLADMRTLIVKSLIEYDYRVAAVSSAKNALNFMESQKPDVIITDLMMSGIDGFEFIKILRSDSEFSTIPIIILSAKAASEDVVKGLEYGANAFIAKPFSNVELVSNIDNLLTIKSNEKEIERLLMYKEKMAEVGELSSAFSHEVKNILSGELNRDDILESFRKNLKQNEIKHSGWSSVVDAVFKPRVSFRISNERSRDRIFNHSKGKKNQKIQRLFIAFKKLDCDFNVLRDVLSEILSCDDKTIYDISDSLYMVEYFKMSSRNFKRIRDLTKSMLNYSRISDEVVENNMDEIVDSCVNILATKLKSKKIQVAVRLKEDITISHTSSDLFQVVLNILGNAIDSFTEVCKERTISVWNELKDDRACFHFENNGPVIKPEDLDKIFKKNFSTKGDKGNGIGLYICKQLVEKNGAILKVSSTEEKTIFTIVDNKS